MYTNMYTLLKTKNKSLFIYFFLAERTFMLIMFGIFCNNVVTIRINQMKNPYKDFKKKCYSCKCPNLCFIRIKFPLFFKIFQFNSQHRHTDMLIFGDLFPKTMCLVFSYSAPRSVVRMPLRYSLL